MTERDPEYVQDICYTANDDRLSFDGIICGEGVKAFADLRVTENTPAGLSVVVAAGGGWVDNDNDTNGGVYHVYNDAAVVLAVPPNVSGVTRADDVWVQVCDSQYAAVTSGFTLVYTTGTNGVAPVDGCTYYQLASVLVPDSASTITGTPDGFGVTEGNITDERNEVTLCGSGNYLRTEVVFTTSGTFDKASYPWLKSVKYRLVGGGGAGGGTGTGAGGGSVAAGAGGGGGGYVEGVLTVDQLAASVTVTIGAGGTGVSDGSGNNGGTTSFGAFGSATGGRGGENGLAQAPLTGSPLLVSANNNSPFGDGGVGSGGDANTVGGKGSQGYIHFISSVQPGLGGGNPLCGEHGGNTINGATLAGLAGKKYGGGGSGSSSFTATAAAGGAGAPGVVILELFG